MDKKRLDLAAAMFKHYVRSQADNQLVLRMQAAIQHEMTCGDLTHGHGVIKVTWDKPTTSKEEEG